jgi:predicted DNA-binding protein (MmcQ/YjbR family)
MVRSHELGETLRRFGLGLPGAHEDHPWGELVLKAKGKVFVFLGKMGQPLRFSVKLPCSGERLLDQPYAEPTGYGLGKSGWVTLSFEEGCTFGEAELCALIEESYRAVALKTLVKELDARASPIAKQVASPAAGTTRPRRKA